MLPSVTQVTLVLGSSFVTWIGYFRIIRITFAAKAFLGLLLLYVGPEPWAVIIFFLCIRYVAETQIKFVIVHAMLQLPSPNISTDVPDYYRDFQSHVPFN